MRPSRLVRWLIGSSALTMLAYGTVFGRVQPPSFDKLNEADRNAFRERFRREIWPLLVQGGKDGCVGCHNGKKVTTLRFRGDAETDFRMLVRDGYFLKDDAGSLLERVVDKDRKRRMPPDNLPPWTGEQVQALRGFVNDLDRKNGK
jgi:hypothetical protein